MSTTLSRFGENERVYFNNIINQLFHYFFICVINHLFYFRCIFAYNMDYFSQGGQPWNGQVISTEMRAPNISKLVSLLQQYLGMGGGGLLWIFKKTQGHREVTHPIVKI